MAGKIPPLRPGTVSPGPADAPPPAVRTVGTTDHIVSDTTEGQARPPSIRNRLQTLFGWKAPTDKTAQSDTKFFHSDTAHGKSRPANLLPWQNNATGQLSDPSNHQQFAAPLRKPKRPLGILKMLENNDSCVNGLQEIDSPGARSWRSLAQTSLGLEFERNVAELTEQKSQQLMVLQAGIAQLPPDVSLQYQALLSDIVTFHNPAERDTMLADLARDVAARLRSPQ